MGGENSIPSPHVHSAEQTTQKNYHINKYRFVRHNNYNITQKTKHQNIKRNGLQQIKSPPSQPQQW